MYALAYVFALFFLPVLVLLAGGWIMEYKALTSRGVNVVAGGMFASLAGLGVVLVLVPAPFGA